MILAVSASMLCIVFHYMPLREKSELKPLNMCFSDFVCEQSRKSLDPVVFTRDFHQYLYIFSPIKCMFYGNYVLCVARQSRG